MCKQTLRDILVKFSILLLLGTSLVHCVKFHQSYSLVKAYYFETIGFTCVLINLFLANKIRFSLSIVSLVLFAGVSTFLSANPFISYYGANNRGVGYNGLIVGCLLVVSILSNWKKRDWEFLSGCLSLLGLAYGVYAVFQYTGNDFLSPVRRYWQFWQISFAGNSNMAGNVMALCLPFALHRKNVLSIIFCCVGLMLVTSRGAIIAGGFVLIFWFVRSFRSRLVIGIILFAVFLLMRGLPDNSKVTNIFHYEKNARFTLIKEALPLAKNFFGVGPDMFRSSFAVLKSKKFEETAKGVVFDSSHNILSNTLYTLGYIPFLLLLYFYGRGFRVSARDYRFAWIAYFIWGISSFNSPETDWIVWTLIAKSLED